MEIEPHALEPKKTLDVALKIIGTKAREKRQQLVIEVAPNTPMLYADEWALKQILINLVSNAIKFTPEGGRIAALVASRASSGDFQLMVEDNGPGIPPEKLDKCFTPFSQVDNRYDRQAAAPASASHWCAASPNSTAAPGWKANTAKVRGRMSCCRANRLSARTVSRR